MSDFKKFFNLKVFAMLLVAVLMATIPSHSLLATDTITQTTTSSAVAQAADRIVVASATGFSARQIVYMDVEAMQVDTSYVSGTTIPVIRGILGTKRAPHASGVTVFVSSRSNFYASDVSGACTSTSETALPHINPVSGNIYQCSNSQWALWRSYGNAPDGSHSFFTYTAAGAITLAPGMHFVNGTTLAMTLASPTRGMDGMVMSICAANASAHTLTYTGGFGGGGSGEDVATYSGVAGDCLTVRAANSLWWVIGYHQVTLA